MAGKTRAGPGYTAKGYVSGGSFSSPPCQRGVRSSGSSARLVEAQHRVELAGQVGVEVVAPALGLWPVDHANRPFEALHVEHRGCIAAVICLAQAQQEAGQVHGVEERLKCATAISSHGSVSPYAAA